MYAYDLHGCPRYPPSSAGADIVARYLTKVKDWIPEVVGAGDEYVPETCKINPNSTAAANTLKWPIQGMSGHCVETHLLWLFHTLVRLNSRFAGRKATPAEHASRHEFPVTAVAAHPTRPIFVSADHTVAFWTLEETA